MNYKKLLFIFIFFIIICINVNAQNTIYSIDVNVYIDKEANASIEEKWHVKGSDGTEWYKPLRDLGKSELSNFTVSMDGNPLQKKNWNVNESLNQKRGYYGINYSGSDTELCFGKYDLLAGVICISFGIFLIVNKDVLYSLIPFCMGVILFMDAVTGIIKGLKLKKLVLEKWWIIFIINLIFIAFAIYIIVNSSAITELLIRIIGGFLIVDALLDFLMTFKINKNKDEVVINEIKVIETKEE